MSKRGKAVDYGTELENLYKRWEHLYEHGGSDPFWSDGVNANLVKNQIVYCKNKIKNENSLFLLPDAYYRDIPPELPNNYMARPDEIRENALKAMAIIDADENFKFVREQSKSLSEKQLKRLCIPAIIGYAENIHRAVAEDDLLTMRRYEHPDGYLDSFRSAAERIRSLQFSENLNERLSDYEADDEEEFEDMRRAFAYLTKQRFIAPDVISFFAHQHKIYEDRDHHNVVFVGTDENGIPKQASLRSTISFGNAFRITVSGSDTKYSFSHFGESGKLFVFEAPIDMLSFITLYQKDWKDHSYIAMNGVYESAVLEALKCHSNLSEIVLCTDNDAGGIDAAERLRDILRENRYSNIFRMTSRNKDWNEDLKELHGLAPIPASVHLRKELFSENVSQLEFESIKLNRIADSLNAALRRNKYTYVSNIALSASAEILAKINEKPAEDMFENLRKHLLKEYRAYADRGKIFSKTDALKKFHLEAIRQLKNYPATKEQMKNIAKSLFDLADSALKCSTEQQMSEQQEQEEAPRQNIEIKMSI